MEVCVAVKQGNINFSNGYSNLSSDWYLDSDLKKAFIVRAQLNISTGDVVEDHDDHYHPKYFYIPILFYVIGIITNAISFVVMRNMKNTGDALYQIMANLCVSDALVLLTTVIYYALNISNSPLPNSTICALIYVKCVLTSGVFAEAFTTLSLVAFTTLKLSKPLHTMDLLKGKKQWVLFLMIWLLSFSLGFSVLFKVMVDSTELSYSCVCITYAFGVQYDQMESLLSSALLGISIIIVSLCYGINFQIARNARKNIMKASHVMSRHENTRNGREMRDEMEIVCLEPNHSGGEHNIKRSTIDSNYKFAVTAILLYAVLIIFWLPYVIVNLVCLKFATPDCPWYSYIVTTIFVLNAILDPVIYGIRLRSVRKGYVDLFKRIRKTLWRLDVCRKGF